MCFFHPEEPALLLDLILLSTTGNLRLQVQESSTKSSTNLKSPLKCSPAFSSHAFVHYIGNFWVFILLDCAFTPSQLHALLLHWVCGQHVEVFERSTRVLFCFTGTGIITYNTCKWTPDGLWDLRLCGLHNPSNQGCTTMKINYSIC